MARIARILRTVVDTIAGVDAGAVFAQSSLDDGQTALTVRPSGLLSKPRPEDLTLLIGVDDSGVSVSVADIDPMALSPDLAEGETTLYSRTSEGAVSAFITLRQNGSIEISNGEYSATLSGGRVDITAPDGVNINGVEIDSGGNVQVPGTLSATGEITSDVDVKAAAVSLLSHIHAVLSKDFGNTGPPQ